MDEIYLPRFAGDKLPSTQTGICLALADRLDTLVGIFSIGQIPTGNKDPFALRRASLGIIRIIIEKELNLDLKKLIALGINNYSQIEINNECPQLLFEFFNARIKAMYFDKNLSKEVISSVLTLGIPSPLDIHKRLNAVDTFKNHKQANSLAESNKRVANILSKNTENHEIGLIDRTLLNIEAEQKLVADITSIEPNITLLCSEQNYEDALSTIVTLKPSIDNFFESVMVMDEDAQKRTNRLAQLGQLRSLFLDVADISCIQAS